MQLTFAIELRTHIHTLAMEDVRCDTVKLVEPRNRLAAKSKDTRPYKRSLCFTQVYSQLRYGFKYRHLACWLPTIQLDNLACYMKTFAPGPHESFWAALRTMCITFKPGGLYTLDPLVRICHKLPNLKLEFHDEGLS
jgi:hypothetical protein